MIKYCHINILFTNKTQLQILEFNLLGGEVVGCLNSWELFFFFNVYMFCLQICLCTPHMADAHGGQKVPEPLELELQTAVNCQVGAGI